MCFLVSLFSGLWKHHPLNITCLRCERVLPRTENEFQSRFVGFWGLDFDYTQPPLRLLVCKGKKLSISRELFNALFKRRVGGWFICILSLGCPDHFCNVIRATKNLNFTLIHLGWICRNLSKVSHQIYLFMGKPRTRHAFADSNLEMRFCGIHLFSKTPNFEAINMSLVEARRALLVGFFLGLEIQEKTN